jgi:hypothetical protein
MLNGARLVPAVGALVLFGGCANVNVYAPDDTAQHAMQRLKGIPFYIKVPILMQETKHVVSELLVEIDISELAGSTVTKSSRYPASGPLHLSPDIGKPSI